MKKILFTICSANYLPQVAALQHSLTSLSSDYKLKLFLCDEIPSTVPQNLRGNEIINVKDIDIPCYELMVMRYSILELNTSVKPFCIQYLIGEGADYVYYLDPDLFFYNDTVESDQLLMIARHFF